MRPASDLLPTRADVDDGLATPSTVRTGLASRRDYRADIDGLRGIAVALVCLFHAGIGPFNGGYMLLLSVVWILSLVLSIIATPLKPNASFYLLPTRAWELLTGVLLAMWLGMPHLGPALGARVAETIAWFGMLAIIGAAVVFRESTLFPYWNAALPVGGAVAIIWANAERHTLFSRLLSSPPLVFLGLISYSVYLWHWVALAVARWLTIGTPTLGARVSALAIAVMFAYASWRWVEQPTRAKQILRSDRSVVLAALAATVAIAGYGYLVVRSNGFPTRGGTALATMETPSRTPREKECFDDTAPELKYCVLGDASVSRPSFIAIGDSHGLSMLPALDELANERHLRGLFAGTSGCLPFVGALPIRDPLSMRRCRSLIETSLRQASELSIRHVVLLGRWDYYTSVGPDGNFQAVTNASHKTPSLADSRAVFADQFTATVRAWQDIGVTVHVVLQVPHQRLDPQSFVYRKSLPRFLGGIDSNVQGTLDLAQHRQEQSFVEAVFHESAGVQTVDPAPLLCPQSGTCLELIGNRSAYVDRDHLSIVGATWVAPALDPIFARIDNSARAVTGP